MKSDPGRVTWQGTCSHDGCDLPVKAKRVPKSQQQTAASAAPAGDGDVRVIRVDDYDDTGPDDGDGSPISVAEPGRVEPDPAGSSVQHSSAPTGSEPPADPISDDGDTGAWARFRERRRAARARSRRGEWQHPLGI